MIKQFVVGLPSKAKDYAGELKSKILNKIANNYPNLTWHGIDCEECPLNSVSYAGPGDYLTFGIDSNMNVAAFNKRYYNPNYSGTCYYNSIPLNLDHRYAGAPKFYDAETQLDIAMYKLHEYAKFVKEQQKIKGYDFEYQGQPVKIYPKFIQVGYSIIPYENYRPCFNCINATERKNIFNIIINISNSETVNNIYVEE